RRPHDGRSLVVSRPDKDGSTGVLRAARRVRRRESKLVSIVHTSGTTGGELRFPITMRAMQEQWATWWRYRGWHGIRPGTWWPSSPADPSFHASRPTRPSGA